MRSAEDGGAGRSGGCRPGLRAPNFAAARRSSSSCTAISAPAASRRVVQAPGIASTSATTADRMARSCKDCGGPGRASSHTNAHSQTLTHSRTHQACTEMNTQCKVHKRNHVVPRHRGALSHACLQPPGLDQRCAMQPLTALAPRPATHTYLFLEQLVSLGSWQYLFIGGDCPPHGHDGADARQHVSHWGWGSHQRDRWHRASTSAL